MESVLSPTSVTQVDLYSHEGMTGLNTSTCNFLKVFIEILQSFYNPVYDISHAELWWEKTVNTSWKFTFLQFNNLPSLFSQNLKSQKIESIKGKSLITLLYFTFFTSSIPPRLPSLPPQKSLKTNHTQQKLLTVVQILMFSWLLKWKNQIYYFFFLTLSPFKPPGKGGICPLARLRTGLNRIVLQD